MNLHELCAVSGRCASGCAFTPSKIHAGRPVGNIHSLLGSGVGFACIGIYGPAHRIGKMPANGGGGF